MDRRNYVLVKPFHAGHVWELRKQSGLPAVSRGWNGRTPPQIPKDLMQGVFGSVAELKTRKPNGPTGADLLVPISYGPLTFPNYQTTNVLNQDLNARREHGLR